MFKNGMRPVHPGEILLEDYLTPMDVAVRAVALALHVPYSRLRKVVTIATEVQPFAQAPIDEARSVPPYA